MNILCRLIHAVLGWLNNPLPPDDFIDIPADKERMYGLPVVTDPNSPSDHVVFYVGIGPGNGERRWADDE